MDGRCVECSIDQCSRVYCLTFWFFDVVAAFFALRPLFPAVPFCFSFSSICFCFSAFFASLSSCFRAFSCSLSSFFLSLSAFFLSFSSCSSFFFCSLNTNNCSDSLLVRIRDDLGGSGFFRLGVQLGRTNSERGDRGEDAV